MYRPRRTSNICPLCSNQPAFARSIPASRAPGHRTMPPEDAQPALLRPWQLHNADPRLDTAHMGEGT